MSSQDKTFRPKLLAEIIGQHKTVEALKLVLDTHRITGERLPHMIFQGPPGLGKTTLGTILANEISTYCQIIHGGTIDNPKPLIQALSNAKDNDIVFIDELHALPDKIGEVLYHPLEDQRLYLTNKTANGREIAASIKLKNLTIIGATTNVGHVPKPLLDRLTLQFNLTYYSDDEIKELTKINALKINLNLTDDAAINLSRRCKSTPRILNSYLEWLRNYSVSKQVDIIGNDDINKAFEIYGVDEHGLDDNDRAYMEALKSHQGDNGVGLKALASITGIPDQTIENHIEPFLLRKKMIVKGARGRMTAEGNLHALEQSLEGDDDFLDFMNSLTKQTH